MPYKQEDVLLHIADLLYDAPSDSRLREELELEEDVCLRLKTMSVSLEGGYENNKAMN